MRRLLTAAATASLLVAQAPVMAEGTADDIGVMNVNLSDVVKPNIGFQGQTQGAGTPNQAGIGGFLPLVIGESSVFFVDVLANANFSDFSGYSSIVNTQVSGVTVSTSSRLGYRWLNDDRSWMFGINSGYDSRPMNSGATDTGIDVSGKEKSVFFQQVAANIEAVSNGFNLNAYALVPVGDTQQRLNPYYESGALDKYGVDVGYFITPELNASVGYYYQAGDEPCDQAGGKSPDGSGVLAKLGYELTEGLTLGAELSYDQAYETRVLGKLSYRFSATKQSEVEKNKTSNIPVIKSLTQTPSNRTIFVHDSDTCVSYTDDCTWGPPKICCDPLNCRQRPWPFPGSGCYK